MPTGFLEDLPPTVSRGTSATELLARILLSRTRRTINGLLRTGEAALAEEVGWPLSIVRKRIRELEDARVVLFDRDLRDLLVLGVIACDGPKTRQSTIAMARQAKALKPSRVRAEVHRAIVETLSDGKHDELITIWRSEFGADSVPDSTLESTSQSNLLPVPGTRVPSTRDPKPVPHQGRDVGFNEFWAVYPRKHAKLDALKAWRQQKPDQATLDQIISDVQTRARSEDWTKDGRRFIPLPATYLRGQRWHDEGAQVGRAPVDNDGRLPGCSHEPGCTNYAECHQKPFEDPVARAEAQAYLAQFAGGAK